MSYMCAKKTICPDPISDPNVGKFLTQNLEKVSQQRTDLRILEPTAGLEPATYALRVRCSTN